MLCLTCFWVYNRRMYYGARQSNLKAILQQHYRRFVASADFIVLPTGETVIEVIFDGGKKEFISRGETNNENSRNAFRNTSDLSRAPA